MKKLVLTAAGLGCVLAFNGCVGESPNQSQGQGATLPPFSHSRDITNPYLPLASLKQDILENKSERVERTARPDVHKVFQLGGQTFEALTVEDREYTPVGDLIEATLDYFAQDDDWECLLPGRGRGHLQERQSLRPQRRMAAWQGHAKTRRADAGASAGRRPVHVRGRSENHLGKRRDHFSCPKP